MSRDELFAERMRIVLGIGEANAAHHRAQALAGGAQIMAMQAARDGGPSEAEADEAAAQAALAVSAARIEALEAELAAVDAALAAAAP